MGQTLSTLTLGLIRLQVAEETVPPAQFRVGSGAGVPTALWSPTLPGLVQPSPLPKLEVQPISWPRLAAAKRYFPGLTSAVLSSTTTSTTTRTEAILAREHKLSPRQLGEAPSPAQLTTPTANNMKAWMLKCCLAIPPAIMLAIPAYMMPAGGGGLPNMVGRDFNYRTPPIGHQRWKHNTASEPT